MATGIVARLIRDKGFGFVRVDGSRDGDDVFFHRSSLAQGGFDSLEEGTPVTFTLGNGPKGPRAEDVRVSGS